MACFLTINTLPWLIDVGRVTKMKAGNYRDRVEVNLGDWFACLNTDRNLCNTMCGLYWLVFSFHSCSVSSMPLHLYTVCLSPDNSPHPSRLDTGSIAAGFPLIHLVDAHKCSYWLCNDRLIGSFGCLFCYCPLTGALGVSTVYNHTWAVT